MKLNRTAILSFAGSGFVHVIFFAVLAFGLPNGGSSTPYGVQRLGDATIIEIGVGPAATTTKPAAAPVAKAAHPDRPNAVEEVAAEGSEAMEANPDSPTLAAFADRNQNGVAGSESRFGLADGVAADGVMGSANGRVANAKARYIYELKMLLEGRKIYPAQAKRMKEAGKVVVKFQIQPDGRIHEVSVTTPSPSERLNGAAKDLVAGIGRYRPLPAEWSHKAVSVEVPIEYVLE